MRDISRMLEAIAIGTVTDIIDKRIAHYSLQITSARSQRIVKKKQFSKKLIKAPSTIFA